MRANFWNISRFGLSPGQRAALAQGHTVQAEKATLWRDGMTDDSMLEKLAKGLHIANYEAGRGIAPPWPSNRFEREHWYYQARAALKLIRDVEPSMLAAGQSAMIDCVMHGGLVPTVGAARSIYFRMIDAASGADGATDGGRDDARGT